MNILGGPAAAGLLDAVAPEPAEDTDAVSALALALAVGFPDAVVVGVGVGVDTDAGLMVCCEEGVAGDGDCGG